MRRIGAGVVLLLAACAPKPPETPVGATITVHQKTWGDVTGTVRKDDADYVTLDTKSLGQVVIPRTEIEAVDVEGWTKEKRWYGWQIIVAVLASDAIGITGAALAGNDKEPAGAALVATGIAGHVFSGSVIHLANGEPMHAGTSVAVHLLVPLLSGLLIAPLVGASCSKEECAQRLAIMGGVAGLGSVAAFAWDASSNSTKVTPKKNVTVGAFGVRGAFD